VAKAQDAELIAEGVCRGEGVVNGLLSEARATDLLVWRAE
jgi:hypothetical protein